MFPSHYLTARSAEILERLPDLEAFATEIAGRAMLVRRSVPVPFECVVRGYLSGSAWAEYRNGGTLAGEPLPAGLAESARLDPRSSRPPRRLRPATMINVTFGTMAAALGRPLSEELRQASFALYQAGRDHAAERGIIIADTKFEFGSMPAAICS